MIAINETKVNAEIIPPAKLIITRKTTTNVKASKKYKMVNMRDNIKTAPSNFIISTPLCSI